MTQRSPGKVYIVGGGPGNAAYLTVQAHHLLTQAEVLIYDALVDESVIDLTPANCLRLNVGKRGGQPSSTQAEINQLLVQYCQQGQRVVRLKGGDPFVFGRTTTEIQALIQAHCEFEVVPGLSSALAAPLLANIPLTDPVMSRCFAVITAHEPEALDWEDLARLETLVILMGGRNFVEILHQLQRHGRSPQTPIAVIQNAGCLKQQVWVSTLRDLIKETAITSLSLSPCVIVVGEVVGLRDFLSPSGTTELLQNTTPQLFSPMLQSPTVSARLPLTGITLLVTRSEGQSSQFRDLLMAQGATVMEMPTLVIGPPSSWAALDLAIAQLEPSAHPSSSQSSSQRFDWLILTSSNGVRSFFARLFAQGKDARTLAHLQIAVVGQKTADVLQQYGLQSDFIPPEFVADSLVEHFPEALAGQRILFPRVESGGREVLVQQLTTQGAMVVEVPAYESYCPQEIDPEVLLAVQQHQIDILSFASSKTVKHFYQLVQGFGLDLLEGVGIASIGPQTSIACQQWLGRVDIEATEYTLPGLTAAIVKWANSNKSLA
ncbi:MAG: uroporphyrinogen-III C-methyltransferase [Microcoleaceae cyanobacterium]